MKNIRTIFLLWILMAIGCGLPARAQIASILGMWKTVDDKTGEVRALVDIYQDVDGLYYGKIEKMFRYTDAVCDKCEGDDKGRPLQGLIIIRGMKAYKDILKDGYVLDPETGKQYHAIIRFNPKTGKLQLRGSLDRSGLLGRNQYWIR